MSTSLYNRLSVNSINRLSLPLPQEGRGSGNNDGSSSRKTSTLSWFSNNGSHNSNNNNNSNSNSSSRTLSFSFPFQNSSSSSSSFKVKSTLNFFFRFIVGHFKALYDQLDPIQTEEKVAQNGGAGNGSQEPAFNRAHYIFAFALSATFDLYGTFGFHLEHGGRITAEEMAASPYTFSHQVSAPLIWAQVDSTWALNCTTTLVILVLLMFMRGVPEAYVIRKQRGRFYVNGKELHPKESAMILKLSRTLKLPLLLFILTFLVSLNVYFLLNVYLNDVYDRNWRSVFWWLIVFPVFLFYLLYALFGQIMLIILSVRYIRVKQKTLLEELIRLNASLDALCQTIPRNPANAFLNRSRKESILSSSNRRESILSNTRASFSNANFQALTSFQPLSARTAHAQSLLVRFLALNRHLVFTCKYIQAYSAYCSPIISTIVPFYIAVQCHLFFVTAFKRVELFEKYIYSLSGGECHFFLFLITHECAYIVGYCHRIEREMATFCFRFNRHFRLPPSALLQFDLFAMHRRLQPYSFNIFSYFRISSKTYYMVISYICLVFMFLIKDFYH